MSEKKDFLNQFSEENKKPDSFKEEQLIPVTKPKREIKPAMIIIPLLALAILGILSYFLFFAPKIVMKDFVGQNKNEVAAFIKQQEIDTTGIIFKEEYSLDYPVDTIIAQSIEAGKKIGKKEKIDFTISLGADPDEKIKLPDIESMSKADLDEWVNKNKLQKTKVTTAFSETVPEGEVISYDLKGDADSFTRGTTLNIVVSKGPAPAGQVAVEDFKGKTQYDVETWAKNKKVKVDIVESYSDEVAAGSIISQVPASGTTLKEGESLTIYVSKGKGVRVPDFTNMGTRQIEAWSKSTGVMVDQTDKKYSNRTESVLYQSVPAGNMVTTSDYIYVTKNAGQYFYATNPSGTSTPYDVEPYGEIHGEIGEIVGMHYDFLVDTLNKLRTTKGIDAYADDWTSGNEVYSDQPRGTILSVICRGNGDDRRYDCGGKLPLDVRFDVTISRGKKTTLTGMSDKTVYELVEKLNLANAGENEFAGKPARITFVVDNNIHYDDYSKPAILADQAGNPIEGDTIDVFEDKFYVIKLR